MKNTFLKMIGGAALAFLSMAIFAQISVSAQDVVNEAKSGEKKQEDAATRRANARKLEGSWDVKVTPLNCQTGLPAGLRRPQC